MSRKVKFAYKGEKWELERTVFRYGHSKPSLPRLIIVAAIHGNEPSGLRALLELKAALRAKASEMNGEVIGFIGNFRALEAHQRFIDIDLNRIWKSEDYPGTASEVQEKEELKVLLDAALEGEGPRYVIDLHTTSSDSDPFLSIADTVANRHFARQTGVTSVSGIERFIKGALLEYVSDMGHVGLAFEAGQHQSAASKDLHKDFVMTALHLSGVLENEKLDQTEPKPLYDIIYRHGVSQADDFKMNPGYENFSPIHEGVCLAEDRQGEVRAPKGGLLFMPLYQTEGDDGFFIVR